MGSDKTPTVLLVDDEESILKSLRRLLQDEDVKVLTATSGAEALKLAQSNDVALVISDQRMPGMTGVELLHQLRDTSPDSIRILLTGYADLNATVDAINSGAVRYYIGKPWDADDLLSRIRESLELFHVLIENRDLQAVTAEQNDKLQDLNQNLEKKVADQTWEIRERHKELNQSFMETIKAFSTFIELRHKEVGSHSQRVASMAKAILKGMSLTDKEYQDVVVAAYLHDIGKISLPDSILKLHPNEYRPHDLEAVRKHPILGQTCVYNIGGFEEIGVIIRHHHENFDGSGYPDRLSAKSTPLGSRIIRICDAFDHHAFADGYPDMKTLNLATAKLVQFCGTDFDAKLTNRFVELNIAKRMYHGETADVVTLMPDELTEGMVATEDIHTQNGMFLLPKGAKLSKGMILRIQKINAVDPLARGIRVYNKHAGKELDNVPG